MRENVIAKRQISEADCENATCATMMRYFALRIKKPREAAMVGILAGLIALFAMSTIVVVGAGLLYDPERSYHHE
jgi:hypothetical protein